MVIIFNKVALLATRVYSYSPVCSTFFREAKKKNNHDNHLQIFYLLFA